MTIMAATRRSIAAAALALASLAAAPLAAQEIEQVDPNAYAIDGDLSGETDTPSYDYQDELPADTAASPAYAEPVVTSAEPSVAASQAAASSAQNSSTQAWSMCVTRLPRWLLSRRSLIAIFLARSTMFWIIAPELKSLK